MQQIKQRGAGQALLGAPNSQPGCCLLQTIGSEEEAERGPEGFCEGHLLAIPKDFSPP